jgi:hypothetical protein
MKQGLITMAIGLLVAVVGLAISIGSYAAVAHQGGHYVVAWGAVIFGAISFFRGLFQILRAAVTR